MNMAAVIKKSSLFGLLRELLVGAKKYVRFVKGAFERYFLKRTLMRQKGWNRGRQPFVPYVFVRAGGFYFFVSKNFKEEF